MPKTAHTVRTSSAERGEQRRRQVLDAATRCFLRHGFHGASVDKISKAARMSVGHIYHYFENKEAIIAAMVERDVAQLEADFERIRARSDVAAAMIEHAAFVMERPEERDRGSLRVEMLAEATRNPRIAAILQAAHRAIRHMIVDAMRHANPSLDEKEAALRFEVLSVMIAGLDWAMVRNPELNRGAVVKELLVLFQQIIGRKA